MQCGKGGNFDVNDAYMSKYISLTHTHLTYLSCSTDNGTNIGVILRFPSARRVSICFSIALIGVMVCGMTAGFVDIGTEHISISPNCGEFLPTFVMLLMLLLFTILLLNEISLIDLLSSIFNSSEYSGTMPLSTLDSLKLRSILLPYSRWNIEFCDKKNGMEFQMSITNVW